MVDFHTCLKIFLVCWTLKLCLVVLSQINKTWKENLEIYRLHIVKKIQKRLKIRKIVYSSDEAFEKKEGQMSPAKIFWRRTIGIPTTLEINITVEQLPLSLLVQCQRYFLLIGCKLKNCGINFRIYCIQETLFLGMFINLNGKNHFVLFRNYHGNPEMPSFFQCMSLYVSKYGIKCYREWVKSGDDFGSNSEGIRIFVAK